MPLVAWQEKFLRGVEQGRNESVLLKELSVAVSSFEEALKNKEFQDLYHTVKFIGVNTGILCPAELDKICKAQVPESQVAGYFGMTLEEFRNAVEADKQLKSVWDTAYLRGQAEIQIMQFDVAKELRDPDMLKWIGKNYLGQAEKVDMKAEVKDGTDPAKLAKMIAFLVNSGQIDYENAIDALPITADTENALEKDSEKSDNVLGPT